ncbi:MAG: endonuclease/exonuclease/phosphatase family protein [Gemmatimonadaceae bacterium]
MKVGPAPRSVCAALALAIAGCAPPSQARPSPSIRVLVYNIHAGRDAAGVDNLERVAAIVRESGADIAMLQEVDRGTTRSGNTDQVARLVSLTGFHAAFGKTLDYQGGEYGIAVLSRREIRSDTLLRLPVSPPQERSGAGYEPRGALRVAILTPLGELHVFNTHIDASREDFYRLQEARELLRIAAASEPPGGVVVIGGDLNSEPSSAVIASLIAAGWRDAWRCGQGDGLTFPASAPVKRIDYLLLPSSLQCRSARVISTDASDHLPVLFEIARRSR